MHTQNVQALKMEGFRDLSRDPWLLAAVGLSALMTGFLVTVHACCFGFGTSHLSAMFTICSSAG